MRTREDDTQRDTHECRSGGNFDSGLGTDLPEEVRDKMFDPFFATKNAEGTGQGLALARPMAVQNHVGTPAFVTEMGKGRTFCCDCLCVRRGDGRNVGAIEATGSAAWIVKRLRFGFWIFYTCAAS
jgi:light-regulated signal transduction histidine kinase (bacteriophytochrome)